MGGCTWPKGDGRMQAYHDREWCRPSWDERYLFEMLTLEGAQAGLSWRLVLSKRESYQRAFHHFDIEYCAQLTDEELDEIKETSGVIKNALKVNSVRSNARALQKMKAQGESFAEYVWSFTDGEPLINDWEKECEVPAESGLSNRVSKALKKRGFKFVGPITTYSFLQAIGVIDDHIAACPCHSRNRKAK